MTLIDLPVIGRAPETRRITGLPAQNPAGAAGLPPPHAVAVRLDIGPERIDGRLSGDPAAGWCFTAATGYLPERVVQRLADPAIAVAVMPEIDRRALRHLRVGGRPAAASGRTAAGDAGRAQPEPAAIAGPGYRHRAV
jgi:hypothetical protein